MKGILRASLVFVFLGTVFALIGQFLLIDYWQLGPIFLMIYGWWVLDFSHFVAKEVEKKSNESS